MASTLPKTMRAVVCPSAPIPPSGLKYTTEHPTPTPKPGHILIHVKAYGLNRSEMFTRQGSSPGVQMPIVLGIECVGEVVDAGGEGSHVKKGDVVASVMGGMGRKFDGGYAEYTLVPFSCVSSAIKLPSNISFKEFAAIPETFMTAWGALKTSLDLKPSQTLLVRGGTTSLGLALATMAKIHFSASRVISTTRSMKKADVLKAAGVDDVVVDTGKINEEVVRLTDGKGVDACVELVGGTVLVDSCACLGPKGIISFVGSVSAVWSVDFNPMEYLTPHKHLTMYGSEALDVPNAPLQTIVDDVSAGRLKLSLDKVFKMEDTAKAHEYMEGNAASGKLVCLVD